MIEIPTGEAEWQITDRCRNWSGNYFLGHVGKVLKYNLKKNNLPYL